MLEDDDTSEIILSNLSVAELYVISNISPNIEKKVSKHLYCRGFDGTYNNIGKYLIYHGLYRYGHIIFKIFFIIVIRYLSQNY